LGKKVDLKDLDVDLRTSLDREYEEKCKAPKFLCCFRLRPWLNFFGILIILDLVMAGRMSSNFLRDSANKASDHFAYAYIGTKVILIYPIVLYFRFW
jgi:hypothetical protein